MQQPDSPLSCTSSAAPAATQERPNSAEPFVKRRAIEELQSMGFSQSIAARALASALGIKQRAINFILDSSLQADDPLEASDANGADAWLPCLISAL
jgi:uncharacterized UBP type Zn finger protein